MIKKSISEVSKMKMTEINSTLVESPAFKYLKEKEIVSSERGALELSSFFTLLLKIAWINRDLTKAELRYLVRESKDWSSLSEEVVKELIDVHSDLVRRNAKFASFIPFHVAHLGNVLDEQKKHELFEILVIISRGDLEVAKVEENYLDKVGKCLKLDGRFLTETIMNGKFLADVRKEKKAIVAQPDDDQPYEVPEIHFKW